MLNTVVALGIAGVALLFLEMFLPGMIAGIIGAILLIAAVFNAYFDLGPVAGNITLFAAAGATGGLWWFWATKFQHTRFGRRMTLTAADTGTSQAAGLTALVGQTGNAVTPLRPSGTILIGGKRVDAITGGDFIEKGTGVRVVRIEGAGVVVHRID